MIESADRSTSSSVVDQLDTEIRIASIACQCEPPSQQTRSSCTIRSAARVAMRVRQGGHDVPADVVRRRFDAGWRHFDGIYRHHVDYWQCFDNSGPSPVLLSEGGSP
jgi:hypothetical protein